MGLMLKIKAQSMSRFLYFLTLHGHSKGSHSGQLSLEWMLSRRETVGVQVIQHNFDCYVEFMALVRCKQQLFTCFGDAIAGMAPPNKPLGSWLWRRLTGRKDQADKDGQHLVGSWPALYIKCHETAFDANCHDMNRTELNFTDIEQLPKFEAKVSWLPSVGRVPWI